MYEPQVRAMEAADQQQPMLWCKLHRNSFMPDCPDCELAQAMVLSMLEAGLEPPLQPDFTPPITWCPLHATPEELCAHCRQQVQELDQVVLAGRLAPRRHELGIRLLSGKELQVPFSSDDTVADVKTKLSILLQMDPERIKLTSQVGEDKESPLMQDTDPVDPHLKGLHAIIQSVAPCRSWTHTGSSSSAIPRPK